MRQIHISGSAGQCELRGLDQLRPLLFVVISWTSYDTFRQCWSCRITALLDFILHASNHQHISTEKHLEYNRR